MRYAFAVVLMAAVSGLGAAGRSGAARTRRTGPAGSGRGLARSDRRQEGHVPHPRAECPGREGDGRRHPRQRAGRGAMTKGENGVWEVTLGAAAGRLSLQLQRRRRGDGRPAEFLDQRVEHQRLEPGVRAGRGVDGHQSRAARRGGGGDVLLGDAEARSAACTSTRRRDTRWAQAKYPVFYLLHGAGDNDDAWTSVGRAGFILDNLIAAKKAKPMVVVMPAGHTQPDGGGGRGALRRIRPGLPERHHAVRGGALPRIHGQARTARSRASRWAAARR